MAVCLAPTITLNNLVAPMSLAVSPDNSTVLIVDEGTSEQLKAYNTTNGNSLWIFGQAGGYANGPSVSDDKFFFNEFHTPFSGFVCYAPDGSFWVGDPGNCRVQHYSAARNFLQRMMFHSRLLQCCSRSRITQTGYLKNILSSNMIIQSRLIGRNGSWTLVNNWGYNIPSNYNDAYFRLRTATTLSNGRTYAFLRHVNNLGLVELTTSGLRFTGWNSKD